MGNKILPVYFFPGPEAGAKTERIQAIENQVLVGKEADSRYKFYPYDTSMDNVISLLQNGSLFATRRVIQIADAHALKPSEIPSLIRYCRNPSHDNVLIITTEHSPGSREYPKKLADALPKNAIHIFWEMFERDKRSWIMNFFRKKGLRIQNNAVDLLMDLTEGTTTALSEACERICFKASTDIAIECEDIDNSLEHNRQETLYSLFDRFCRRDITSTIETYRAIARSEPAMADRLPVMLADSLSSLMEFQHLHSSGTPEDAIVRSLGIRGGKRAVSSYRDGMRQYTSQELTNAFQEIVELEAQFREAPRELRIPETEVWLCKIISKL